MLVKWTFMMLYILANLIFPAAINAGKIISFWNLPHLSYSSPDPELADKEMYTTLVRMISPFNRLGSAMVDIFKHYEVSKCLWQAE